uniref:Choline/carnitine acyltransferase domain-containing protein n=1 Tax=Meloidogyne enterolobii TaxID=390850 RepID=A0A6V7VFD7_MELEN|nr:unnamed protein product [Meloidogyne enterolobii]
MIISQLYKKVLSSSYNFKLVPRSTLRTFERMRIDPNTPKLKLNNAATTEITANDLPKLPVPQLEHTIEKFLKFCKPILGPEDYGETLKTANEFKESIEAKQLQKILERRAQKLDNWLTPWWLDIAYLSARTPLPVVTSPGITFPYSVSGRDEVIDLAAKIIQSALLFHHKILTNDLAPDKGHGHVLFDMEQYKLLFGTTRIPKLRKDEIRYGKDQKIWAEHILVMWRGNIIKVSVCDDSGRILSITKLKKELDRIMRGVFFPNTQAINIVSSTDRDTWAEVYARVKENNPESIKIMEDSLFIMCLDESDESYGKENLKNAQDENMSMALHGGGANKNSRNRWFDKTLQFYVNENGYAGITYEHTPAEGPPLARLLDFICDQIDANNFELDSGHPLLPPQRIHFKLGLEDAVEIGRAEEKLERVVQNLEVKSLAFNAYGKNVPKRSQLSPDSWIQLALQIAHYRLHKIHPPTYETGTLRKFSEGRTDTIRLPTTESVAFVEEISARPRRMSDNVLLTLLEAAIDKHKKYSLDVMDGNGIDRHLLGLKLASLEDGWRTIPQLFNSIGYQKLMHFKLSTSQVPTKHVLPMGFGPSAPDCYGVCYNPQEHKIFFTITAFNECKETSAERFSKELETALLDMHDLVERTGRLKEKSKL